MTRIAAFILLACAMFLLVPADASAQRSGDRHGFRQTYPGSLAIGLAAGANANLGTGGPSNICDCDFESGSGVAYHAGMQLDIMVNRMFGIRFQGLYEDHSSIYEADRSVVTYSQDGAPVQVNARRRDEVQISYLSTAFLVSWYTGASGIYLLAGASAGFFVDGNVRDEEYITTPGFVYTTSQSNRMVFSDGPVDAGSEVQVRGGLVLGVGFSMPLARGMAIAPELQFDYPLTSVVEGNDDWSIPTMRASVVFRFGL